MASEFIFLTVKQRGTKQMTQKVCLLLENLEHNQAYHEQEQLKFWKIGFQIPKRLYLNKLGGCKHSLCLQPPND